MAQSRAARLVPVVDMAEKAEREAARMLGRCQTQLGQVENQLNELHRYRGDYQKQLVNQGQQGVSGQWLINYQRFLSQLETAVAQQQRNVDFHRENLRKARDAWQTCYTRLEGLRKLVQRYIEEARAADEKREQKQLDELAARLSARRTD
ncbi:flagellar export protein FliJ [Pseudomonas kuykendallii]|uniref:flagellar export protein FliJ n=1 Tax=Pseudomonas kuykendallii TaxID=1007099 RepID=UPI0028D84C77|nr:flagellar export protein FliJ [Pseudomonas kuykendallii]